MKKITVIERICSSFINNCDYNINNLVLKYSVLCETQQPLSAIISFY